MTCNTSSTPEETRLSFTAIFWHLQSLSDCLIGPLGVRFLPDCTTDAVVSNEQLISFSHISQYFFYQSHLLKILCDWWGLSELMHSCWIVKKDTNIYFVFFSSNFSQKFFFSHPALFIWKCSLNLYDIVKSWNCMRRFSLSKLRKIFLQFKNLCSELL